MKLHGNAALSWSGRRRLVERVEQGWTLTAAAEAAGVSVRCAQKWVGRYRLEGEPGLRDRSSAPRRVANRTPPERVEAIVVLRRLRFTAAEIADLRTRYPSLSLRELAAKCRPPATKAAAHRRLTRLRRLAEL